MAAGLPARLAASGDPRPAARIVHLGLGAFFRAFGCTYLSEIGGWGVTGVSFRSSKVRDALAPQDFVYTASERGPAGIRTQAIEVVRDILVAPENPQAVLAALCAPQTEIVTLTITEKGYCHDPATRQLNLSHPDILHDLAHTEPRSAPGYLVRGLAQRRAAGLAPFTVLSCDNLPNNGELVRRIILDLAKQIDPELSDWIDRHGAFPSSMVDRIVPATTDADIRFIEKTSGVHDAAPVHHEPFRQWVIEKHFLSDRPAFEDVGVQMVDDVRPFEDMKLRMLNGAHSALSYLGILAGHNTVSAAVADPLMERYLRGLWTYEIMPTLQAPANTNLCDYAEQLLNRFANPGIEHRTDQIAIDGSQKIPQRLLDTIDDRLAMGRPVNRLLLAVAGWIRYTKGCNDAGDQHEVDDPLQDRLSRAHTKRPDQTVRNFLSIREVFEPAISRQIEAQLIEIYSGLCRKGAKKMLAQIER